MVIQNWSDDGNDLKYMWAPFLSNLLCKSLNNNDCKWRNDSMNNVILLTWSKSEVNFMKSQIISHFSWTDHKRFPVELHWFQQELKKEEKEKKTLTFWNSWPQKIIQSLLIFWFIDISVSFHKQRNVLI